uniref:Coiled-coil domain-containing protein 39 n=1 Tax=Plectus sambesii TaxID=2011161 RepID=A0A914VUU0_9BILA
MSVHRRQQEDLEAIKNSDVLVHIADTSYKVDLNNYSQYLLSFWVNEKQKTLSKLQRQSEQLAFELASLEERAIQIKQEKHEMKAILTEKERQLETESHLLKLSENEKRRHIKESVDMKTALAAARERNNKLNATYDRQKQLHDSLIDKGQLDNHMFEAQLHKILDTEQMGAEVKKFQSTDNRTAKELEIHLKRLTQKIFDKQQELEKQSIGQKINQTAIDIAKRDLRNSTKERQKLTEKWEGTFGVLQRKIA